MRPIDSPALRNFTADQLASFLGLPNFKTYIHGCIVSKTAAANTIDVSAGAAYDPTTGRILSYAGATGIAVGTLGASQWNQVYLYGTGNGVGAIEVVNNADPTATPFAGVARNGGSAHNGRWIGGFLTDASSNIIDFQPLDAGGGNLIVSPKAATNAAPFRVLAAGTAATYTAVSLAGAVPRYATSEVLFVATLNYTAGASGMTLRISVDGVNNNGGGYGTYVDTSFLNVGGWSVIDPSVPRVFYLLATGAGTGGNGYLDVWSYRFAR